MMIHELQAGGYTMEQAVEIVDALTTAYIINSGGTVVGAAQVFTQAKATDVTDLVAALKCVQGDDTLLEDWDSMPRKEIWP